MLRLEGHGSSPPDSGSSAPDSGRRDPSSPSSRQTQTTGDLPQIVATQKFRSSRPGGAKQHKQQEDVVGNWDAESDDERPQQDDPFEISKKEWTKANNLAPTSIPVLSDYGRTLPSAAYGSGFSAATDFPLPSASLTGARCGRGAVITSLSGVQQGGTAPPKILQRPKNVPAGMNSSGGYGSGSSTPTERKTVGQRQEEYRLARARIFGQPTKDPQG